MANPLFQQYGNSNSGIAYMIRELENFKQNFRGDARGIVQNMLNTGQLSQARFNELAQQANQLSQMLNR